MDVLKAQLLRIQQQLSGLTASQRMLTASLVAIMVMTIIWWGRYASTAELEPVLDQSLSAGDIGQIKTALESHGIVARVVGDRVMVPADRRLEAVAMLAYADALPSNSANAWDEMVKQMSPWDPKSKTDTIQNHMKEQMLSQVITSFFPGVAKANVIINPVSERRVGASLEPSASVQIATRGREINVKRLVEAAAATVASAQAGLTRSRVSVVVDGIPRRPQDPGDGLLDSDLYEQIDAQEKRIRDKILENLWMPSPLVAVTVKLDPTSSQETRVTSYEKNTFVKEKSVETKNEETLQPLPQGTDPGAMSNVVLSLATPQAQPIASTNIEQTRTENLVFPDTSTKTISKLAGTPTVVAASVRVPRSYFVSQFKAANPNAKEPDDNALLPLITAEMPKIRGVVLACTAMKTPDSISVDTYFDGTTQLMVTSADASAASTVGNVVGGHAKEIALGALAVFSLLMVSMIVKKGTPATVIAAQLQSQEIPRLNGQQETAGVVGDGESMLDGMELDDDAVRAQQMVEQVSTMVKDDPDAAANLVKRWLNRS